MWKVCKVGLAVALFWATLLAVPSAHAEWEHSSPNDSGSYLGGGDPEPTQDYQGEPDEPFDRVGQVVATHSIAIPIQRPRALFGFVALIKLSVLRWTAH